MIRFFAKRRAKREYVQKLELEAATNEINAQLAMNRAKEKRAYIEQLNREADDIEANIAKEPFSGTDGISPNECCIHTSADPEQSVSSMDA
jgi:hypothetical protein